MSKPRSLRQLWSSNRWLRATVLVGVSLVCGFIVLRLLGSIQWSAVGDAFRKLAWWEVVVLLVLLLVRQFFNAAPVSRFTPGLSRRNAMVNDLSANVVGTLAPPPGDVVMRVAQFRTWGIHPVDGMAGVTLNMIVFYGARFIAPVIGLIALAFYEVDQGHVVTAAISGAIAAAIIVALILALRSDAWAASLGRSAARAVGTMRADVDIQAWQDAVVEFRGRMDATLRRQLAPALVGMLAAVLVDAALLTASLRFVGVTAAELPTAAIIGMFLLVYPLTILPLFGLGVMDAILVAAWAYTAGESAEAAIIAGTVVWRTVTLGGTLALGALAVAWWKRGARKLAHAS